MTIPLRGLHNVRNAMLALAVARECGVHVADAAAAIAALDTSRRSRRCARRSNRSAEALLINDAYNSNPASARAALALLGAARRRDASAWPCSARCASSAPRSAGAHDEIARDALRSGATHRRRHRRVRRGAAAMSRRTTRAS